MITCHLSHANARSPSSPHFFLQVEKVTIDHGEQHYLTSYDPTKQLWVSVRFSQPGGRGVNGPGSITCLQEVPSAFPTLQ